MFRFLNKLALKVLDPLVIANLPKVGKAYEAGEYKRILKFFNEPVMGIRRSDIFNNVFRVLCLIKTDDDRWEYEYRSMLESGQLSSLSSDNKMYIQSVIGLTVSRSNYSVDQISEAAGPNLLTVYPYKLSKVDRNIKRIFPVKAEFRVSDSLTKV